MEKVVKLGAVFGIVVVAGSLYAFTGGDTYITLYSLGVFVGAYVMLFAIMQVFNFLRI